MQAGRTVLKLACEKGNLEIATLLIDAQCDVNLVDSVSKCEFLDVMH